jgi:membrane-bound lytic murein transglycosylase F
VTDGQVNMLSSSIIILSVLFPGVDAPREQSQVSYAPVISQYDEVIQRHASHYRIDWRLISAIAYTESRFNPSAKSKVGAQGLLQVMPATGRELGFDDVQDLEANVEAGTIYMKRLIRVLTDKIPPQERVNFALAGYNAGLGHVYDAQKLAREMGLNPYKWFGNVEKAIVLLQKPENAAKARYGYCRGGQPVAYVARVRQMEANYRKLTKKHSKLAS